MASFNLICFANSFAITPFLGLISRSALWCCYVSNIILMFRNLVNLYLTRSAARIPEAVKTSV